MKQTRQLTAIIEREGDGFLALCPELDIASQGTSVEGARGNLAEAVGLFFEVADPSEIESRIGRPSWIVACEGAASDGSD